ncbi:superkiller complex protein 2-like, partial [Haemorhous mexicanus]|uniref:superkiller complex protein 2-like n=1 Tax=Haemorhous mexicanus TaxID=30427 RepID=UPI0028BD513F
MAGMEMERIGEGGRARGGRDEGLGVSGDSPVTPPVPPQRCRPAAAELPLALLELGCSGRFEVLSGEPGAAEGPEHRATLPQGLPPWAPPPLGAELERKFLGTPEGLPLHGHERAA